jgi:hypothetical protein
LAQSAGTEQKRRQSEKRACAEQRAATHWRRDFEEREQEVISLVQWAEKHDHDLLAQLPLPDDFPDGWAREQYSQFACAVRLAAARADKASRDKPARRGRKWSTDRGEAEAKLIAALLMHHRYDNGWFENDEPIGVNELARRADVSKSTASLFLHNMFGSHARYKRVCQDKAKLRLLLRELNGEHPICHLLGDKAGSLPAPDADSD